MGNFVRFGPNSLNSEQSQNNPGRSTRQPRNSRQQKDSNAPSMNTNAANNLRPSSHTTNPQRSNEFEKSAMYNTPSAPPPYDAIYTHEPQHLPSHTMEPTQEILVNRSNPLPSNIPAIATQSVSNVIIETNTEPNRSRRSRQNRHYDDEYSDDPSDYESDHNRRKMYGGYYSKRDYYDEDKDYIYYKTPNGHRYKQYKY